MEKLTNRKTDQVILFEHLNLPEKSTSTSIAILGLGGIGGKVITHALKEIQCPTSTLLAINTDLTQLTKLDIRHTLHITSTEDRALIPIVSKHDTILTIAGAGGVGEALTLRLMHMTHQAGKKFIPILYKPFEFEGIKRNNNYQRWSNYVKKSNGGALVFDNQVSIASMNQNHSFLDSEQLLLKLNVEIIKAINGDVHVLTKDVIQSLLI